MDTREDIEIDLQKDQVVEVKRIFKNNSSLFKANIIRKNPKYLGRYKELIFEKHKLKKQLEIEEFAKGESWDLVFKEHGKIPLMNLSFILTVPTLYLLKSSCN